jgi:hypothetical protein
MLEGRTAQVDQREMMARGNTLGNNERTIIARFSW